MQKDLSEAQTRAAGLSMIVFDVDGVLTDGAVFFGAAGEALKAFNTLDGQGITLLARAGVETAIITGRSSSIVAARAAELGIRHVYQGVGRKTEALEQLLGETRLRAGQLGYMGDDWPDLAVMQRVGLAAAPANAHTEVLARAHWHASRRGGEGAVRELCDFVLRAKGCYDGLLAKALEG